MCIVYYLENFCFLCVLWMLEELGLDYELCCYLCDLKMLLVLLELCNVYLFGKLLVLQDGELVLVEFGVIFDYFVDCYDMQCQLLLLLMLVDGIECIVYCYWLYYVEGLVMLLLLLILVMGCICNVFMLFFVCLIVCSIVDKVEWGFVGLQWCLYLDWMECCLVESLWFVGECFSVVDIQMSFLIQVVVVCGGGFDDKLVLCGFFKCISEWFVYQCVEVYGGYLQVFSGN